MRKCKACGSKMTEGYCIDDGMSYFCSTPCLHTEIPEEEYLEMFDNDCAYWTQWEDEPTDEELLSKFICPHCKADLKKVGIELIEKKLFTYTSFNQSMEFAEFILGEGDGYFCRACHKELENFNNIE